MPIIYKHIYMRNKRERSAILIVIILSLILVISCASPPESTDQVQEEPVILAPIVQEPAAEIPIYVEPIFIVEEESNFDPENITEDLYTSTLTDVQSLIAELNNIIRARNYNLWRNFLSDSYFNEINSREFLEARADELFRRDQAVASGRGMSPGQVQRRNLTSARDYFEHIVVPSRQNDRVDDITFITENHVIAYTVDNRGNRLILYSLEIIDGDWKIVN